MSNYDDYVQLVNRVQQLNYEFFVKHEHPISDSAFDAIYDSLLQTELEHPDWVLPDSPTQKPASDLRKGKKAILHRTPMLSTEKTKTASGVKRWMQNITKKHGITLFSVEWKYDGISASLVYLNGKLAEASTRGNGKEGNDILAHCLLIPSIPHEIPMKGRVEVRGEILMPYSDFKQIARGYKTPRAAASGLMALDTPNASLAKHLSFYPYQCDAFSCLTNSGLAALVEWGFKYGSCFLVDEEGVEGIINALTEIREEKDYPTDGLVFKVAYLDKWEQFGHSDHHYFHTIAYKFAPKKAEAILESLTYVTGANGQIYPIAHFSPTTINGTTFTTASIGSMRILKELDIMPGDKIMVGLANDVIPHVYSKVR